MQEYTLTLVVMKRTASPTVTLSPVIPCFEKDADGFVRDQAARIVTHRELLELGHKANKEKRPPTNVPNYLFLANLKLLVDARERNDLTAARKAESVVITFRSVAKVRTDD